MSDKPRTDAAIKEYRRYGGSPQNEPVFCSAMFELEEELNIITAQRDLLVKALVPLQFYAAMQSPILRQPDWCKLAGSANEALTAIGVTQQQRAEIMRGERDE